jgi:hypothetical protein
MTRPAPKEENAMQSVDEAVGNWSAAREAAQEAAAQALRSAYSNLERIPPPTGCCPVQLRHHLPDEMGRGQITVCVDEDGRGTIDITGMPSSAIGTAIDTVYGTGWFDGADGPLSEATGQFGYDDDLTHAEYDLTLSRGGPGSAYVAYIPVPDAAQLLNALATELARQQRRPPPRRQSAA